MQAAAEGEPHDGTLDEAFSMRLSEASLCAPTHHNPNRALDGVPRQSSPRQSSQTGCCSTITRRWRTDGGCNRYATLHSGCTHSLRIHVLNVHF